ncbi:hypothetical protein M9434_005409 [Picochlorum sp. BPE23]|nr:hypothetical protein M9434_005409 [Picochlorum sp. BPE23]
MAAHGKLSSKIRQLKFMQRAAATDRDKTTHANTTEEPSVSYRVQDGQGSSGFSEDWAVEASKTRCIVMTRTNPSIATESRQGILSFGPIDVEEQQEALVTKDIGAAGQGDMPFHDDDDDDHPSRAKKRKSPPQQDTIPHAHGMDGAVADAMHPEASSGSTMHSKKKNKKKNKKKKKGKT